jgi:hypothetical protein
MVDGYPQPAKGGPPAGRSVSQTRWLSLSLNSEIEQVVLLLVLEKSRYLSVTLMQRNGARRFGPGFDAQSQQIEHEHDNEHEHDF